MHYFTKENRAGLYLTISFHLIVLIIFLTSKIHTLRQVETSFVLDFTQQEELESAIRLEEFKQSVSEELDEILSSYNNQQVRNVVVNQSDRRALKDDRSANPAQVYDDALDLQRKLDASKRDAQKYLSQEDYISTEDNRMEITEENTYTGPSVISYTLDNRRSLSLPIPAYKCYGGGDVAVAIIVNRKGYVTTAKIIEERSVSDICIRDYAINAAKKSRFTASSSAPERQAGEIVYRFVEQ